ncbi:hypothetical protein GGF49_005839 [Coemansia sp. RSA 1853]|nr:hypothetical protein GGF49_005839 [Coemansia sp. RSA 1853]
MTKDPKNQYQSQQSTVPLGDSEDAPWFDACAGSTANSGTWQWKHLRDQGLLTSPTTAAAPWVRQWDDVSQTPWLFNPSTKQFISYDDTESIKIKLDYAASKGLAGSMIWSINMDYNNELLDTVLAWKTGGPSTTPTSTPSTSTTSTTSSTKSTSSQSGYSTSTQKTTTTTSTTATSSIPTQTATVPGGGGPSSGASCPSEGANQCSDTSGKNSGYYLCLYGKWTARNCGSGTACFQNGSSIICNWPSS